jgi:cytochrome c oxidase subunit 4
MNGRRVTGKQYVLTYVALIALATASLLVALAFQRPYADVGIAMAIATAKTVLVVAFFMHMLEQPFHTRFALVVAALLVLILVGLTVTDVVSREVFSPRPLPPPTEGFYVR